MIGKLSPAGAGVRRPAAHRRGCLVHAVLKAGKRRGNGGLPPCKSLGRPPSFSYGKRPRGRRDPVAPLPLEPANNSLAMWTESLISAFPSPTRKQRAALFPDSRIALPERQFGPRSVCPRLSQRFEPQRLGRRLQGEAISFGLHMSLNSRSNLGIHRLLWQHSG